MQKTVILSDAEKDRFERWVLENIDERIVPDDEGSDDGIRYNLIHALRGDFDNWDYTDEQLEEMQRLNATIEWID